MKVILFFISLALFSCTSREVEVLPSGELPTNESVVIFLHGYYGSALSQPEEKKIYYPSVMDALVGKFPVSLESHQLSLPPNPNLVAEGTIGKVVVIPKLYEIDVYAQGIQELSKDLKIYSFSYDWRTDLFQVSQELDDLVKRLKEKGNTVSLMAHSMGGLVASYYLAFGGKEPHEAELTWEGAKNIERAVFLGTPFGGSVSIFRNMIYGTGYTWNSDVLPPLTVSSFASSYFLLPFRVPVFETSDSKDPVTLPLGNPDFWRENKIGLAAEQEEETIFRQRYQYMETKLLRASSFLDLLFKQGVPPAQLRLLNIVGKGKPTLGKGFYSQGSKSFVLRPQEAKASSFDFGKLEVDGDGSVAYMAAKVPPAFSSVTEEFVSSDNHDRLFDSPTTKKKLVEFLKRKEP